MDDRTDISAAVLRLCGIMAQLRAPHGCPWDARQTHASLEPFLIEEAYEVVDAIHAGNKDKLKEELGDLLLQVVFHAQIAAEAGEFSLVDVAMSIADKLVARHPHVFADDQTLPRGPHELAWDQIKQQQQRLSGESSNLLAGIPRSLPALQRSQKVLGKAVRYGVPVARLLANDILVDKENSPADEAGSGLAARLLELAVAAQAEGLDLEQLLRKTTRQIERRFTTLELQLANDGRELQTLTEEEWVQLWMRP